MERVHERHLHLNPGTSGKIINDASTNRRRFYFAKAHPAGGEPAAGGGRKLIVG
jgi:hypothetical protein